jgi:Cytochrome P460
LEDRDIPTQAKPRIEWATGHRLTEKRPNGILALQSRFGGEPMQRRVFGILVFAGILIALSAGSAQTGGYDIQFPSGFRDWFVVNSMIVTKDSPISAQIGGLHIIYVNAKGLPTLKKGGPFPYPDGTVFADDVHEFSLKDGSYVEGNKKAIAVMVKDAKKYPTTGGWGFQVWSGGDPSKPLLPDAAHAITACFACHTPQKEQDYTFSTYIP